ncbi:MAG: YecA family protein [Candidatus Hydrothermarchaeota archaeon]
MYQRKIGRNDPCPCGSGEKYKKCCLSQHLRIIRTVPVLKSMIDEFSDLRRFKQDIKECVSLFLTDIDIPDEFIQVRVHDWFIFNYTLSSGKTILQTFKEEKANELSNDELEILEEWENTIFGVFQITKVIENKGVNLKDIFTGREYLVEDLRAAKPELENSVLVTRIMKVFGTSYFSDSVIFFPANLKERLYEFGITQFEKFRKDKPDSEWDDFIKERGYVFNHFRK